MATDYHSLYAEICSLENLHRAWQAFRRGKLHKPAVAHMDWEIEEHLCALHRELTNQSYRHGPYNSFIIHDPKRRTIHKAHIRDRIVHHAIVQVINPLFERTFIADSYSCRVGKGTHRAVDRLETMLWQVSRNLTGASYALKCDIKKFFHSIDHQRLLVLLYRRITEPKFRWLLGEIIGSFESDQSTVFRHRGLPLGNLTSQLFGNIIMNEFDQFVKHRLRIKQYVRYTDDFVIVSEDPAELLLLVRPMQDFLETQLGLRLHPDKIEIRKYRQGVDFLGYMLLPHHRQLRTKTRRRLVGRVSQKNLPSYLGVLDHATNYRLTQRVNKLVEDRDLISL